MTPPSESPISAPQQMLASCSGALITSALVTPFDVVKIRIQAAATNVQCPKCMVYFNGLMDHVCLAHCKPMSPLRRYKLNGNGGSAVRSLLKIVRHEGPFALWSGLPPTLIMAIPSTVIYFTAYDNLKFILGYTPPPPGTFNSSFLLPFVAGGSARLASVTVISPLELIRTKMQSQKLSYKQIGSAVREAISQGGIRSLWSGWVSTLLRDVPFSAFYFCGYEISKIYYSRLLHVQPENAVPLKVNFASGATSALIASVLTQPFDVVKTRTQIQLGEANFGKVASVSTASRISTIVAQQGLQGLYIGMVPRLLKVMPACAIMITSYEYFKEFFTARNKLKGAQ